MQTARVVGNVVATIKDANLASHRLLVLQPVALDQSPVGRTLVALDAMGAGVGEYVFFVPPDNALVRRHFGPDSGPFGKRVIGMPGDVVAHDGSWVSVNGVRVAHMKPRSRDGEVLTPGPVGRIPDGCFYVGTPHPDGFDSRYAEIGFACRKAILGTGTPIL